MKLLQNIVTIAIGSMFFLAFQVGQKFERVSLALPEKTYKIVHLDFSDLPNRSESGSSRQAADELPSSQPNTGQQRSQRTILRAENSEPSSSQESKTLVEERVVVTNRGTGYLRPNTFFVRLSRIPNCADAAEQAERFAYQFGADQVVLIIMNHGYFEVWAGNFDNYEKAADFVDYRGVGEVLSGSFHLKDLRQTCGGRRIWSIK